MTAKTLDTLSNKLFKFPCGCSFKVVGERKELGKILVYFRADIDEIPLDCERTWDLISDGNVKGIFQLEGDSGAPKAKQLKPRNIEHLAALTAIMRPGCTQAFRPNEKGKNISICDHYILRKNGEEAVDCFHPELEEILSPTYGEMIYQEQAMQIAQKIAGFNLQQADVLRKAIGKKKADIMAKVKTEFLEGCKQTGLVTDAEAETIFGWIEKSQRYSFNKSHSIAYAMNAYLSAFTKAHFPKGFFTSYLHHSMGKPDQHAEIRELTHNARIMSIDIWLPDMRNMNSKTILKDQNIYFGLTDIRDVGESGVKGLNAQIFETETALGKKKEDWSWYEFLVYCAPGIGKTMTMGMIEAGALDYFKIPRKKMLFEYGSISETFGKKEFIWLQQHGKTLGSLEKAYDAILSAPTGKEGACANKKRHQKVQDLRNHLKNPPYSLVDTPEWIAATEQIRLGIAITCNPVDACDTSSANTTCRDFITNQEKSKGIIIAGTLSNVMEFNIRNGKNAGRQMCRFKLEDGTANISCVTFSDEWEDIKKSGIIFEDNKVLIAGERNRSDKDSLVVRKGWQLT